MKLGPSLTARCIIRVSYFLFVSSSANFCMSWYLKMALHCGHLIASQCFRSSSDLRVLLKHSRHVVGTCLHSCVIRDEEKSSGSLKSPQTIHSIFIFAVTCYAEL